MKELLCLLVLCYFYLASCTANEPTEEDSWETEPPEQATEEYEPLNASAFIEGNPLRQIFMRWFPKGLYPFTNFTYELKTTEEMQIELHCSYISLHQPCGEYSFSIKDGPHTEVVCGRRKKYFYHSNTNNLNIILKTGKKGIIVTPRCTARPLKKN